MRERPTPWATQYTHGQHILLSLHVPLDGMLYTCTNETKETGWM